MKLSLIALTVTSFCLLATACGTNEDASLLTHTQPQPEPTGTGAAAPPAPRRMIEGAALSTSPVNLIADPGFGLVGQQAGFGSFLAFDEDSFSQVELTSTFDSRSPAGFGGSIALVRPDGATNTKSAPVLLLTSFQGGAGPFHAKVWVSRSTVTGKPVDLSIDARGIVASVTDGTPDGEAFDLAPVEGSARTAGGRTWTLLRADVTKPLAYGGFFVVHTGTGGGQFHVAAPEITAEPLVAGLAGTRSLEASTRARSLSSSERAAILRYKARRPELRPAR